MKGFTKSLTRKLHPDLADELEKLPDEEQIVLLQRIATAVCFLPKDVPEALKDAYSQDFQVWRIRDHCKNVLGHLKANEEPLRT